MDLDTLSNLAQIAEFVIAMLSLILIVKVKRDVDRIKIGQQNIIINPIIHKGDLKISQCVEEM